LFREGGEGSRTERSSPHRDGCQDNPRQAPACHPLWIRGFSPEFPMPPGAAPQSMKIFPLFKGDGALGEGARGMSNRPQQGHPRVAAPPPPSRGDFHRSERELASCRVAPPTLNCTRASADGSSVLNLCFPVLSFRFQRNAAASATDFRSRSTILLASRMVSSVIVPTSGVRAAMTSGLFAV